jgi:hypothetical protein
VFGGVQYLATSVKYSESGAEQDISDLSLPSGSYRNYAAACIKDGAEVQIEFFGITPPPLLQKLAISFAGLPLVTGDAICTKRDLDASVGNIVRGTATFRLSYTASA